MPGISMLTLNPTLHHIQMHFSQGQKPGTLHQKRHSCNRKSLKLKSAARKARLFYRMSAEPKG